MSFIVSDVVGDPLDVIAGGPTVVDQTTSRDCSEIIDNLGIRDEMPAAVLLHLSKEMVRGQLKKSVQFSFEILLDLIKPSGT